jgi:hypothetical protein
MIFLLQNGTFLRMHYSLKVLKSGYLPNTIRGSLLQGLSSLPRGAQTRSPAFGYRGP